MPGGALVVLGTALFGYDATKKVLNRGETTPVDAPAERPAVSESDD